MIYTLNYPTHPIERVNQVVYDFLKNSIHTGTYSRIFFPDWFRDVMRNSRAKDGNLSFEDKFMELHTEFQKLDVANRQLLFDQYEAGIDIKSLCFDKTKPVVLSESYSTNLHASLKKVLNDHFFVTSLKTNTTIQKKLNTSLNAHYIEFKKINRERVCPFCGLHTYSLIDGENKDGYDHWLYKAKYPLYAINFSNLVPMCEKCNQSSVKGIDDVIHNTDGTRRESFYPYEPNQGVNLSIIEYVDVRLLAEDDKKKYPYGYFNINITQNDLNETEKVGTWKSVFNIQTRFNSFVSVNHIDIKEDFHDIYLEDHPEYILSRDLNNLKTILNAFKNQIGNIKRKTGVMIDKAYIDFICSAGNEYLLFDFCKINLAD